MKDGLKRRNSVRKSLFISEGEIITPNIASFASPQAYYNLANFELIKQNNKPLSIGSGAFGDVFLAKSKRDGKFFAIKHVNKEKVISSGASLDIMRREIDIQMRLSHPNIVSLYSYYETQTYFSLLMEYLDNGTLFTYIRKHKKLDEVHAFEFFIQIANSVHFLHVHNFVHRDIKPENILLDKDEKVKLCDFGWCVDMNGGERSTFCGTYEYMAPEIVNDESYDKSIDIWSLGVLLYEMTHGYSPFRAKDGGEEEYKEIFRNIIKMNYTIDKTLGLSKECVDLIEKLLCENSKERITIQEVFMHKWVLGFEQKKKNERVKDLIYKEKLKKVQEIKEPSIDELIISKPVIKEKVVEKQKKNHILQEKLMAKENQFVKENIIEREKLINKEKSIVAEKLIEKEKPIVIEKAIVKEKPNIKEKLKTKEKPIIQEKLIIQENPKTMDIPMNNGGDMFDNILNNVKKCNALKKSKSKKKKIIPTNTLQQSVTLNLSNPKPKKEKTLQVSKTFNTFNMPNNNIKNENTLVINSHNNINNYYYNGDMTDDIFSRDRELERTAPSSKNNSLRQKKRPIDFDDECTMDKQTQMLSSIKILEKAERVREESERNFYNSNKRKVEDESFWDKFLSPFKCGKQ